MRRLVRAAATGLLLAALGSCLPEPQPYLVARHEAERVRWYVDENESLLSDEQIREQHLDVARRFGPSGDVPDSPRAAEHYRVQQVIAGSSALYAADIAAESAGASMDLAAEYASIAERWPEQEQLHFLARLREAATLERIGSGDDALAAFRNVGHLAWSVDLTDLPWARDLIVDLEVHVAMLALEQDPGTGTAEHIAEARARLRAEAERRQGSESWRPRRREAELAFLAGDVEGGRESLEQLLSEAGKPEDRAELGLLLGEVHQYLLGDVVTAEVLYRRTAEEGLLIGASAEARVRLVELALIRGTPKIGLRIADELLSLGARARQGRNSAALYWRSRCLLEMGRWTEAIPSLELGSQGDPSSPYTLACAARLHALRSTDETPLADPATSRLLEVAAAVPPEPPVDVPRDWATMVRQERSRFAWEEGVERLRAVARLTRDPAQARAAREAAGKILRERAIFAQRTPDDAPSGRR